MADIKQVYNRGVANLGAALQAAMADYHYAESSNDVDGMADAAVRIAGLEATYAQFNSLANRTANPQVAVPTDRLGLNAREREHARISGVSNEEYSRNKQRLSAMRQRGEYPASGQG
jgi:hypothetical protein